MALLPKGNPGLAKRVALVVSLLVLALGVAAGLAYEVGAAEPFQLGGAWEWIPAWGVQFALGVDGIALVLILMTVVLVPVCILAGWADADESTGSVRGYFAWILVLEGLVIGVFAATDVFLFYVLFEAMLIPMYFLIGRYGGAQRQYAAVKFFLYSLLGGLLMLAALIGLYVLSVDQYGAGTFDYAALVGMDISPDTAEVAVPRVLHRVRDQGPDVAAAHLAARRRCRGPAELLGAAGRRAGQGRHLRDAAPVPAAVPRRLEVLRPRHHHPGAGRHHLRGARGHRPDRPQAPDRLHVGQPLRLHRARASSR